MAISPNGLQHHCQLKRLTRSHLARRPLDGQSNWKAARLSSKSDRSHLRSPHGRLPVRQPAPQLHRQRADENSPDSLPSRHSGANPRCRPQPTSPNVSQQRSLSKNCRIARAGEMLPRRSQVAICELPAHAYLPSTPLTAPRRHESRTPAWDRAFMTGHMCFPMRRDRIESTTSQMDSDCSTGENHIIEVGTCHQASAPGSAKEASSHQDDEVLI